MSLKSRLSRLSGNFRKSKTFSNCSSYYANQFNLIGGFSYSIVIAVTLAHMVDTYNEKKREKKRIMISRNIVDEDLLTKEELKRCSISIMNLVSIILTGHVVGISIGIIIPGVIITLPIVYIIQQIGNIIVPPKK